MRNVKTLNDMRYAAKPQMLREFLASLQGTRALWHRIRQLARTIPDHLRQRLQRIPQLRRFLEIHLPGRLQHLLAQRIQNQRIPFA